MALTVKIVGAGIIGLACARALSARGVVCTVVECAQPGRGASWAAAGMLGAAYEAAASVDVHPSLYDLCAASAALWPAFAESLGEVGYSAGPTIAVGDPAVCTAFAARIAGRGAGVERQSETRLVLPGDGHVDNRAVVEALLAACAEDANILLGSVSASTPVSREDADVILVTAGWRTPDVLVAPGRKLSDFVPECRAISAVGGQMVSLGPVSGAPACTLRSGDLYIVPKRDRIIVGATVEPGRTSDATDAASIARLLQRAVDLVPALADAPVIETWAGVRPGTPDHAPLIGPSSVAGIHLAAGHYRNGILLAPITAEIVARQIYGEAPHPLAADFAPARFLPATA
ncbi:MAG: FAD-dependent oxidoreductase [Pseudomonadota bacterium]